jgi:hypothetical protein
MNSANIGRLIRPCISLVILALSPAVASTAEPALGSTSPWGARRGGEVEVTLGGSRLADAKEIYFYEPGIKVVSLQAVNDGAVKVKFAIDANCRLGAHALRLRTATGISNLRLFSVGALAETAEKEPNSDFAQPQKIALDTTVNGVVENEDVDYYAVEAKKGERISVEVEGLRLANSFFDPYVAIFDAGRFELANSDDAALARQDGVCSIIAPKDGVYMAQVRESSFGGNGGCYYRLHVGRFPRPTAIVPAGGKPGESIDVRWLGDVGGERTEKITLPTVAARDLGLLAKDDKGTSPTVLPIRLVDFGNTLEREPNDARDKATEFAAPMALGGVIEKPGDVDQFKFAAKKGQVFDVRTFARQLRSPLDSVVEVHRIGGAGVGGNDDSGGPDSYLRFTAPEDDTYVVSVRDHLQKGGADYAYRIEVAPVKPALTMGLPERQQYVSNTLSIPKNNRMALLVSASRADSGGPLNVEFKDLPPGVKAETIQMAANRDFVPVVFTAAADANPAGAMVDVIGRPVDANLKFEGHLLQRTQLVFGQNNIDVFGQWGERMVTAVTEAAPFSIEIVEPKAPLVRDGSMELKIVAKRANGFKAPISVFFLYNPPGVGSSGSIAIAEGKTEALIPLTANGGAEIGDHRIVVIGRADTGKGAVEVSSQLATLKIAAPYVGFAFQKTSAEQGKEADLPIKITKNADFEGKAKVELLGLPAGVTTPSVLEIDKSTSGLSFKVKTSANSPAGKHTSLLCRAIVMVQGEPVTHMLYGGELRIDVPLPPKPAAAAATPTPQPAQVAAKPADKPLSPLEKLRQDRKKQTASK